LLMTETAYRDLGREMDGELQSGEEHYEDFGVVKNYVQRTGARWERAREALLALPERELASRARWYVAGGVIGEYRATLRQLLHPAVKQAWLPRTAFALKRFFALPLELAYYLAVIPRRLRARGARRAPELR